MQRWLFSTNHKAHNFHPAEHTYNKLTLITK